MTDGHERDDEMADDQRAVSRRDFIQGAVIVASAAAWAGSLPVAGALDPAAGGGRFLTAAQLHMLTTMLDHLVPAHDAMPAAGQIGIATFIDEVLVEAAHLRTPVLNLLTAFQTVLTDQADRTDIEAGLQELQRQHGPPFEILLHVAYAGYYSHPEVINALG